LDGTIKVWDLPTGGLLESIKTEPATSISFSPQGNAIATTHVNERGIRLWYCLLHVSFSPVCLYTMFTFNLIYRVNAQLFGLVTSASRHLIWNENEEEELLDFESLLKINSDNESNNDLVQLSSHPLSRVQLILNLESVKVCCLVCQEFMESFVAVLRVKSPTGEKQTKRS
jgi:U3 small nucleolar RNA-associated protein 21